MDKLKFINKLIEDRTDSKERFESYSRKYTDDEVFIKCTKACEEALETLKQIKTDLETIESIKQLGINLEDLFKELIDIKNDLGEVDSDITPDYLAYVVSKGIAYGKLSKELCCDLDVVFKALISGIIVRNDEDLIEIGYSDREDKYVYFSTEEIYLKNWQSHGIEKTTNCFQITYGDDGEWCVYLKDYKKTWWLVSDKKGE